MEDIIGVGVGAAAFRRDQRLKRAAVQLHDLPPRVHYELLREIGVAYDAIEDVLRRAELYATLDNKTLAAIGGDRFPPSMRAVPDAYTPSRRVAGGR